VRDRPALYTEPYQGTMPADDSNPAEGQDSTGDKELEKWRANETWTPTVEVPDRVVDDVRRRVRLAEEKYPEKMEERQYSLLGDLLREQMDGIEFVDENGERLEEEDE